MKKKEKKKTKDSDSFLGNVVAITTGLIALGGLSIALDSYKINGELISHLKTLSISSIDDRIKLAVKEERYRDAAELKVIRDSKKK